MNKLYDRIDFVNNTVPALNETNLDLMSKAIDDIDDRVIEIAGDVLVVVPEILDKYADIEALATNPPYVGQNGHWWTWDTDLNQYVDSGVDAGVSVTVGTTTTLPAGSDATVTNSGTDTDPILNFGIPQGATGQNGQDGTDGQDGVSPEVTITTITNGHTITITDADHPTGQSFNVMDGQDGAPGVGVPSGGTTGQVLKKVSGTDFDTEWANESGGGSGGHTIINSAGTSMTQRAGLQFEGMGVTDDSTNDRTKVKLPIFNGTTAQWTALSSTEKAKYSVVNLTDDYGKRLIYEGSFVKGTDTFTDQTSSYYRYVCSKTIGQSNVLIDYDDIRLVPLYVSTSNNYVTGCTAYMKYSESKNSNNVAIFDGFIPGLAYGSFGYVQVEANITPNQPITISCCVGKDIWATFSQAKIRIYAD